MRLPSTKKRPRNIWRLHCGHLVEFIVAKPRKGDAATCPRCQRRTTIKTRES